MLGLDHNPVLVPVAAAPDVPPLPTGSLRVEPVPAAQKPQPQPVMKILLPVIMLVTVGAVMALMARNATKMRPRIVIAPRGGGAGGRSALDLTGSHCIETAPLARSLQPYEGSG